MNKIDFREIENSKCRGESQKRKRRGREWRGQENIIVHRDQNKMQIFNNNDNNNNSNDNNNNNHSNDNNKKNNDHNNNNVNIIMIIVY